MLNQNKWDEIQASNVILHIQSRSSSEKYALSLLKRTITLAVH